MKIFVYGTLKRGEGNNRLLRGAQFVAEGVLENYVLYYSYGDGGFPVARYDGKGRCRGEIWEIQPEQHLSSLDLLEGYDRHRDTGMYLRRKAAIEAEGQTHQVSFYLGGEYWNFDEMKPCPVNEAGESVWR